MASRLYGSHATGNGRSARSGEGGQWTAIINGDVVVIVDLSVRSGPEIDWRLPDYKKLRCESENLSRISLSLHALPAELRLSSRRVDDSVPFSPSSMAFPEPPSGCVRSLRFDSVIRVQTG